MVGAYIIESVSFPEVICANVVHVVSVPCPTDVLIDLHSHPVAQCLASEQDVSVLRELQRQNPKCADAGDVQAGPFCAYVSAAI